MQLAQLVDSIPVVQSTAERGTKFPAPLADQRVWNKQTRAIERFDSATGWTGEVFQSAAQSLGWFNVKDPAYGAKGDNATSDTAAIMLALSAAAATHGEIYAPPATYLLGSTGAGSANACLLIGTARMLRGGGPGATIFRVANGANLTAIEVPRTSQDVVLTDFQIDGNKLNQAGTSHGILLSSDGSYTDGRHYFNRLFIHDTLSDGFNVVFQHGEYECRGVIVRNPGQNGFNIGGSDGVFYNIQCNGSGARGVYCTTGFNHFVHPLVYTAGTYGIELATTATFCTIIGADVDSSQLDNYRINANDSYLSACLSRDPGQALTATYSHMDVAALGVMSGVQILGPIFKAQSKANSAVYNIRLNNQLSNSCIQQLAWDTNSATNGVLIFNGFGANLRVDRPDGTQTLANAGATPDVSGSGKFVTPTVIALTNAGPQTITNFINVQDGCTRTFVSGDANTTIASNATIQLQGGVNFVMAANNTLTLVRLGGVWREMGRHT